MTDIFEQLPEDYNILYFYADWCGPCKTLEPIIEELISVHKMSIRKIDVDEHPNEAQKYGIRNIPTIIKINEHDNIIVTQIGYRSIAELLKKLR